MGGSSEVFRNGEVQLEDLSIGGDFHDGHMRGRVLALFGMFSATTVRNDASPAVGQWDVRAAYKYVSEAYGGYHFNVQRGLNVDAGIFVSYVGLFSYHNFDNWAYQPSYVSSNTPWFFNGVRIQWFPTHHLKIEPWIINGWQSYNKFNGHPGLGGQLKWTPKPGSISSPTNTASAKTTSALQTASGTTPTTASRSSTTTTEDRQRHRQDGLHLHRRCGMRSGRRRNLPRRKSRPGRTSLAIWPTTAGGGTRIFSP